MTGLPPPMSDDELLAWIEAFLAEHRYPPSISEICDRWQRTRSTIHTRLARLHREGRVTSVPGSPRTLVVVQ